ncbi:NAD-dependent epimerase/dehydratase family protein [Luteolibacter marinus]|uniref:NAD-dependent epimerase/dehydratase family protein n=1 Tax=Luteolibacter marinus TaxID=2776705 RepID=UPI0018694357|nr:NAD(P)-dependent oxidoreductase [Luteolibacter marinus]
MKILVTGSSGFIGREVAVQLLEAGHEVCGFDRREPSEGPEGMQHFSGEMLDRERLFAVMEEVRPEVVIHLAAKTSLKKTPPGHPRFLPNTEGTLNLMEAGRAAGTVRRVLFTSTKYVFRDPPPAPHRTYRSTTDYGRSKAAMEELVWEHDGMAPEWTIVRPTTIWGPRVGPHYQRFLRLVRDGRYVNFGGGRALKHLGYVGNAAWQLRRLAELPAADVHRKVLYVGDYEAIALGDWAGAFRDEFGAPPIRSVALPPAKLAARAGDLAVKLGWRSCPFTTFRLRNLTEDDLCDMEPTRAVCGDAPATVEEGVRQTVRWFNLLEDKLP